MPVTEIDKAALIVLDLQVATAGLPAVPNAMAEVVSRSTQLADAFRDRGLPVVWVTAAGMASGRTEVRPGTAELPENWSELLPELKAQPSDHRLIKYGWGAFHDDRLGNLLGELHVAQVVLTGVTTSFAVESTARAAYERNLNVVVVTDAIADLDADAHHHSVQRIFPHLGELAGSDEVLAAL
jgi:nicotinamidase-related amidase